MRLSEVIKKLEKDGTKIFVSKNHLIEMKCQSRDGVIDFYRETFIYKGSISLSREWEEIKQPITFDEVLNNGKTFKCEHPNLQTDYFILSRFIEHLYIKGFNSAEIADIIQNGKFHN